MYLAVCIDYLQQLEMEMYLIGKIQAAAPQVVQNVPKSRTCTKYHQNDDCYVVIFRVLIKALVI